VVAVKTVKLLMLYLSVCERKFNESIKKYHECLTNSLTWKLSTNSSNFLAITSYDNHWLRWCLL